MRLSARSCSTIPLLLAVACDADISRNAPPADPLDLLCALPHDDPPPLFERVGAVTLLGDDLYVAGTVEGQNRVARLHLASDRVARLVGWIDALAPYPHTLPWQPVRRGVFARVHDRQVEVLDATTPASPQIARVFLPDEVAVGASGVLASDGERVFVCVGEGEVGNNELLAVDVLDPRTPGAPRLVDDTTCNPPQLGRFAAQGAAWLEWHASGEGLPDRLTITRLGAAGAEGVASLDLGTLPGSPLSVFRALLGDRILSLSSGDGSPWIAVDTTRPESPTAAVHGDGEPLFAQGREVYVLAATRFYGLDLEDVADVNETFSVAFGPEVALVVPVGHDSARAVFWSEVERELFVVPLGESGEAAPLRILLDHAGPPIDCDP